MLQREEDAESIIASHVSKEERLLADQAVGERLPYNDYTTIDWLHDLVGHSKVELDRHTDQCRSKILFDDKRYLEARAYGSTSTLLGSALKAG